MLKHICVKGIDGNGKILVKPKLLSTRFLRLLARKKKILRHANSATWDSIMLVNSYLIQLCRFPSPFFF